MFFLKRQVLIRYNSKKERIFWNYGFMTMHVSYNVVKKERGIDNYIDNLDMIVVGIF